MSKYCSSLYVNVPRVKTYETCSRIIEIKNGKDDVNKIDSTRLLKNEKMRFFYRFIAFARKFNF